MIRWQSFVRSFEESPNTSQYAPNLKMSTTKREVPDGLWTKCPECGAMLYQRTSSAIFSSAISADTTFVLARGCASRNFFDDVEGFVEIDEVCVPTNPLVSRLPRQAQGHR